MRTRLLVTVSTLALAGSVLVAQTRITPPTNKYSPAQDIQLGRQAATEARQQLPIMRDDAVTSYVQNLGRRLADAIRPDLRHSGFEYTFETVNVREINAFALPGGPMFVNRGMIEAAATEGEVAGVMAHEISHVVLRHGTAQASKATKYEIGQVAGAVIGAIIGGQVGSIVAQGTQFGLGTAFLRFGREYEKQADIEGAQIMSRAGYDAREMANMFKTIEKQGSNGPEWMSDHPNPGNRVDYITKEAQALRVTNAITRSDAFDRVRSHLRDLPRAPTTEEATKNAKRGGSTGARPTGQVERPASRYQRYNEGNVFQISVPSNWRELAGETAVTFAPNGAYGAINGSDVFTHGVQAGIARMQARDLRAATEALVDSLSENNRRLSQSSGFRNITIDGREALQTTLGNVSEVTGKDEMIQLVTMQARDGNLFYALGVAPSDEMNIYQGTFDRVMGSIRLRR